jgi:protocatechuate 3,4-dioxygenase beta subunit
MSNFIVIEKDSLNKVSVNAERIVLSESSIVHTKMSRDDVDEFIRDGNNLVLKLKNGEVVVIENFFITYNDVASDLVFEEDGCVLYWFDGVSGFKGIPGLEALLPAVESSQLVGLLPWLVGAAVVGGAAAIIDHNDKDKTESIPNGTNTLKVNTDGTVTGKTENIPEGTDVKINISGKDKDGNNIEYQDIVKVDKDGNYVTDVPPNFADGDLVVESEVIDRNGNTITAEDKLGTGKTDDPATPGDESEGLDREPGSITVEIVETGLITGTTTDVAPGTDVVLTITGTDANGNPVTITKTVTTDASGNYSSAVTAADGIVDGSAVTVVANTTDRNGQGVGPATDSIAAQGDNDNDPSTPEDTGLDLVAGAITVDIVETGAITGTTTDVAPGTDVVLTITGTDANGNPVTVSKTVTTDASGNYSSAVTAADGIVDGSAVTVVANTTDRNGQGVGPATDSIAAQGDNDNDPSTPEDTGLDLVAGAGSVPDILAGDIGGLKTNFEVGHNYNISIILDRSGSMDAVMPNGQTRIEVAKKALQAFVDQMAQHDGIINLRITKFSRGADAVIQDVVVSNGTVTSIKNTIDQIEARDDTNPETAFTDVDNWLNSKTNGYENQIYYLTDGAPNNTNLPSRDVTFANLAAKSKVFAVGVGVDVPLGWVERYDNTDANGNKINNWSPTNHGEAQKIDDADKLITYLISGSENFIPADAGNDTVKGGAGDDILFGDAMNTNWITGLDPLQYPKYSGYSKLTAHLKATVTGGAEPTQQQVYDYVKANYKQFIAADAADPATKGGDDTIYGGSGDDIIIAGAGNDTVYGGSGNDVISTGRGNDTIVFDVLNAADATGGNGKDTWVDYEANDKIEFGTGFFDGLLSSDLSNAGKVGAFISVANDGLGNTVVKVDRDGAGGNHTMSDLLVLENKTGVTLQDLLNNNQIIIG